MNIDICFVLDCTASMGPWIEVLHQKGQELWQVLDSDQHQATARMAFIGYRDIDDKKRYERWNFPTVLARSKAPEAWRSFLASIKAGGGDDKAEDVIGGINEALSLSWAADHRKLLVHVADGPSHGLIYHSSELEDKYTGFDFDGEIGRATMESLVNRGIDYYFLDASSQPSCNTKMIERFSSWYTAKAKGTKNVMKVVSSATTTQLMALVRDEASRVVAESTTKSTIYRATLDPIVMAPDSHKGSESKRRTIRESKSPSKGKKGRKDKKKKKTEKKDKKDKKNKKEKQEKKSNGTSVPEPKEEVPKQLTSEPVSTTTSPRAPPMPPRPEYSGKNKSTK